ncbi:MAG: aminopeptidase P family protein [Atopobiaceae bacterium]|nr:aminopeptidase P family protein [Atopobiaceae bacterium]
MDESRMGRVLDNLNAMGMEQVLITDPFSIKWLCGYCTEPYERFLGLYIANGAEPVLFVNRLFPDPGDAVPNVVSFWDTDDPIPLVARITRHDKPLGVDKEMAARWLVPLQEARAASAFRLGSPAVDHARARKDAREIEAMRRASVTNDKAMEWLVAQVHEGVTEREIADGLLAVYRSMGAQEHAFTPIVAFGANAADPHHTSDDTVLKRGDCVLFDVGCIQDGYCSDMTRTFFWQEVSDHQRAVYDCVREAYKAAKDKVVPGVLFSELDLTARGIVSDAGWGEFFTHRLGHQIGMVDHEPGDVSATHHEPVEPGMAFSIEPGIYLEGDVGVRIEDLVIVTDDGCEILNSYPTDLVVLGA